MKWEYAWLYRRAAEPCVEQRFSNHEPGAPRGGTGVGEHSAPVLGEVCVTAEEIARRKALGMANQPAQARQAPAASS